MDVVIYHNPECGTSRNVLAIIEAAGYTPTVIEYLKTGWTKPQLLGLFAAAGLTPRTGTPRDEVACRGTGSPRRGRVQRGNPRRYDRASHTCEPPDRLHTPRASGYAVRAKRFLIYSTVSRLDRSIKKTLWGQPSSSAIARLSCNASQRCACPPFINGRTKRRRAALRPTAHVSSETLGHDPGANNGGHQDRRTETFCY